MRLKEKLAPLLKTFWTLLTRLREAGKDLSGVPFPLACRGLLPFHGRARQQAATSGPSCDAWVLNPDARWQTRSPDSGLSVRLASNPAQSVPLLLSLAPFCLKALSTVSIRNFCLSRWSPVSTKQKESSVKAGVLFLWSSVPLPAPEAMSAHGRG